MAEDVDVETTGRTGSARGFWRLVVLITAVGAAIRLVMLVSKWDQPVLLNDSFWYSGIAQGIAKGEWFEGFFDVSGAEHAPLTPILLAPASLLPKPEFWQRATMTLIGIAAIPLIAATARRLAGTVAGVLTAVIAALYPNVWMSDSLIMSETVAMALVTASVLAALHHRERFDARSAVIVGVVIGFAGLARSELLVLAPLYALVGVRTHRLGAWAPRAVGTVVATLLTVLPWVAFNLSRYEEPVFMSTNDGTTLLGANCPQTYGGHALGGWQVECIDAIRDGEDPSERSKRQRHQAVDFVRDNMGRVPIVVVARVLRTLDLFRLGDQVINDRGEERHSWSAWSGIVCFWLLAPLAVLGWRRRPAGTGVILLGPIVCVALTSVVFYGSHRLRAPAEPAIVLCAALWLASLPQARAAVTRVLRRAAPATQSDAATSGPA